VSPATIELLGSTPPGTELRVLCGKIFELPQVKVKVAALCGMGYAIEVRKGRMTQMHGRYIISDGAAWMIDHSLKDFGTRDCGASRLSSIRDLEQIFDTRWAVAVVP